MANSTVCQSKWKPIVEPRRAKPKTYRQAPTHWYKFYEEAVIESEAQVTLKIISFKYEILVGAQHHFLQDCIGAQRRLKDFTVRLKRLLIFSNQQSTLRTLIRSDCADVQTPLSLLDLPGALHRSKFAITKTCLFKYIENFTPKMKIFR